jgi:hypothetical protein
MGKRARVVLAVMGRLVPGGSKAEDQALLKQAKLLAGGSRGGSKKQLARDRGRGRKRRIDGREDADEDEAGVCGGQRGEPSASGSAGGLLPFQGQAPSLVWSLGPWVGDDGARSLVTAAVHRVAHNTTPTSEWYGERVKGPKADLVVEFCRRTTRPDLREPGSCFAGPAAANVKAVAIGSGLAADVTFHALESRNDGVLWDVQPAFVVVYDPDVAFVRQLEVGLGSPSSGGVLPAGPTHSLLL